MKGRAGVKLIPCIFAAVALVAPAGAEAADTIRLAMQKTGTVAWEIAAMKALGLDKIADLDIETTELATTDSGKIALQGGAADLIVSDWLWVARERALGDKLLFTPYSTALGAVMAPKDSPGPRARRSRRPLARRRRRAARQELADGRRPLGGRRARISPRPPTWPMARRR